MAKSLYGITDSSVSAANGRFGWGVGVSVGVDFCISYDSARAKNRIIRLSFSADRLARKPRQL